MIRIASLSVTRVRWATGAVSLAAALALGCGDDAYHNSPYYDWDATAAVGAFKIDHLAGDDADMPS